MVSVGGPPLTDIKYGIIVIPAGDERLLFGQQPDKEASNHLKEALRRPRNGVGLHDVDRDSEEFLRRRNVPRDHNTESAVASVYSVDIGRHTTGHPVNGTDKMRTEYRRAENAQARRDHLEEMQAQPTETDGSIFFGEGDVAMSEAGPVVQGGVPGPTANKRGKKQAAALRRTAPKPQGVVKKSSSPRKKTARADTTAGQPISTRVLRSRGVKR